jgi:hypothetical protein
LRAKYSAANSKTIHINIDRKGFEVMLNMLAIGMKPPINTILIYRPPAASRLFVYLFNPARGFGVQDVILNSTTFSKLPDVSRILVSACT